MVLFFHFLGAKRLFLFWATLPTDNQCEILGTKAQMNFQKEVESRTNVRLREFNVSHRRTNAPPDF
jgi:hypothetical protein